MEKRLLIKIWLLSALCLLSFAIRAQDIQSQLSNAKRMEVSMDDIKALHYYNQALAKEPLNLTILCKCSELSSRIAARSTRNKTSVTGYHETAKAYAIKALQINPANSEANFVMSLVQAQDALVKSGRQKIDAVKDVRKFALLAIRYDAANYKAWHVMGKWYYEITALNIFEKSAVKIFFGAFPDATLNDAIVAFERSKHLNPSLLLNYFELAKIYKENDKVEKAKQQLLAMLKLPAASQDDPALINKANRLLKKWERG